MMAGLVARCANVACMRAGRSRYVRRWHRGCPKSSSADGLEETTLGVWACAHACGLASWGAV